MRRLYVLLVYVEILVIPLFSVALLLAPPDDAYPWITVLKLGHYGEMFMKMEKFMIIHKFTSHTPVGDSSEGIGQFITLLLSMKSGSDYNFSEIKIPVHSGTHVDAPGHFYDNYYEQGFDVDTIDLRVLNGPALSVDVPRDKNITAFILVRGLPSKFRWQVVF